MSRNIDAPELVDACEAMSDLYLHASIIALLESGNVHRNSHGVASRIIKICRAEMGKRLREYDRASDRLNRRLTPQPPARS